MAELLGKVSAPTIFFASTVSLTSAQNSDTPKQDVHRDRLQGLNRTILAVPPAEGLIGSGKGTQMSLMAKRMILCPVTVVLLLSGIGWWANQTSSGEYTDISNGYLSIAAVALALAIIGGVVLTCAKRRPVSASP